MIIFVKRVQNFIYLNLEISLQSFPELMFIQFMFLWLFLWKGDKNCVVGQGGGVFFNPKILIKASPSMRISQSPCQVFLNLCFCNFMFLWLFLWKGAKIAWGARGLLFLTPKSLLRHSHLWEQLNIFVKLSQTHVSLVYVPMIIVFERGAKMTPPV